ncbi:hypothetical protein BC829DRAFT_493664 [Chytridium lagenaria]|nr:hypothetical protein BC829DRAFT_493664 [Chytridium lagenaria]
MSSSSTSSLYSTATNTTSNIPSPTPTETPMTSSLPLDETIALTPASIAEIRLFSKSSAGNYRIVSQGDSSRVYGPVVSSIAEDGDVVILFSVKRTTALQGISNENNISQVPFIFAAGEFSGSEGSSLKKHNIHGSGTFTLSSQFEQKPQPPTDNLQLIVPPNLSQFLPQGSLPQTFIAPEIPDAPPPALLKLTALPPLIPSRPTPVPESSSSTTDNPAPTPTAAPAVPPLLAFPFIVPLPFGVVPAPVPVPAPPVEEELGVEGKALAGLVVEAGFVESPKTTIPPLRIWR